MIRGKQVWGYRFPANNAPCRTRFSLEIICDNTNDKEINLLKAALKSVQDSALGGFSSRGFGKVKFEITSITKRTARYYLGEEEQKIIEGAELEKWHKGIGR